ncbi:oxygenase MpaB family protein [Luteimonas sp. SDU101]|uniref:oxygenase MpaB family protein n=1 Tax=unclassified Luteimonas TaxID=2629088 RepID=UPI003EB927FC
MQTSHRRRARSLADINREAYIYFGAGATVAWQMAMPGVGWGVAEHSQTLQRPLDRLRATMGYVYAVTLGTDADRARIADHVNRAHRPVHGEGYSAFDHDLQLWVAATLYRGALDVHALFAGPVAPEDREALYREAWAFGRTLQVRDEQWPPDAAAFDRWWDAQLRQRLAVDAPVRAYMHAVLDARSAPWYLRPAMPLQRFVTRGLLPARLRALFGFDWSARDERRWRRFRRWAPRLYWSLPRKLRQWPAAYYLGQLRKGV